MMLDLDAIQRRFIIQQHECHTQIVGNTTQEAREAYYQLLGEDVTDLLAENRQLREQLHELRMRVEEADALAQKDDDGEWITGYHFKTGTWHRLLAEVRKGDGPATPDAKE